MTVTADNEIRLSYTGSGTTGPFTTPYFLANADIKAVKVLIADGTEEVLTLTTDYTLTGAEDEDGGALTLVASLSSSYRLVIINNAVDSQTAEYPANDPFPASTHQAVVDRRTMVSQRHGERIDRALHLPDGDAASLVTELPGAVARASKVLGFDADGDVAVYDPASAVTGADSVTFLQSGSGAVSRTIQAVLRNMAASVVDFGAVGDGTTDDTAAVQAAVTAGNCYVPRGLTCKLLTQITVPSNRCIFGPGKVTIVTATNPFMCDGKTNVIIDGLEASVSEVVDSPAYWMQSLLQLKQTTLGAPCSNIAVRNCILTNISALRSEQSEHPDNVGYLYSNHSSSANRHRNIVVTGNQCTRTDLANDDNQGYFVWLWFVENVIISGNNCRDKWGLAYIAGGAPVEADWLVSYQYSKNITVTGNTASGANNGVVFIACQNALATANTITCPTSAGEVLDAEGCRDTMFDGNIVTGGQSLINTFFTSNNVVFQNNILHADTYVGGSSGNGFYNGQLGASDPDIANSGRVVIRNNTFVSDVGEAFIGVGWCKDMVIEGNRLTNTTIYSASGTNSLIVRDNVLDFTVSPTYKPAIQVGKGNTAKWTAATRSPRPKIQVSGNTVEPNLAGGVVAVGVFVDACTQETTIDIFGNRFDNTTSNSFVLETGGGVRRIITFKNNALKAATPFVANAPIATDLLLWKDNTDVVSAIDALGAITGSPATNLTVDAQAITQPGSVIWDNTPADGAGWVYDLANTVWNRFGEVYQEGTWTPTRVGFTEVIGGGTITQTGTYTKIGRTVYWDCKIVAAGGATIAAVAGVGSSITGLPFSSATEGPGRWENVTTANSNGGLYVSGTTVFLTTAWAAATNSWLLSGTYRV